MNQRLLKPLLFIFHVKHIVASQCGITHSRIRSAKANLQGHVRCISHLMLFGPASFTWLVDYNAGLTSPRESSFSLYYPVS